MTAKKTSAAQTADRAPHGGVPGDGAGRREKAGDLHAGVFPVSGPPPDDPNARFQGMASFGQGERGAAGYQDSGQSEVFTVPPGGGSNGGQSATAGGADGSGGIGGPGSNAGEVDPGISGSGETVGEKPRDAGGATR